MFSTFKSLEELSIVKLSSTPSKSIAQGLYPEVTLGKSELTKLAEMTTNFNWDAYMKHAGLSKEASVIIREKSYFEKFSKSKNF